MNLNIALILLCAGSIPVCGSSNILEYILVPTGYSFVTRDDYIS